MSKKKSLSTRQENILQYIHAYMEEQGRPPTIREIGKNCTISSTSVVNYNLNKLRDRGYISRDAEVSRGLRLTEQAERFLGVVKEKVDAAVDATAAALDSIIRIPLKGAIIAGGPVETFDDAYEEDEDQIEIGSNLLPGRGKQMFALKVTGDSMIDALITENDIVIMEAADMSTVRNGDMVAATIEPDNETTLKFFHLEKGQVCLKPANPNYEPLYVDASKVRVQGKVMMVLRQT